MMPGRFFLGVGTGENLNEHIFGDHWPIHDERMEMLEEAIEVIRLLWEGGTRTYRGIFYNVESARIYTLPEESTPIMIAASGPKAAEGAGRLGDGFITTSADNELVAKFKEAGGEGKPMYGQFTVCYAQKESEARRTAYEWWPNAAIKGELSQELRTPAHFEQAAKMVSEDDVADVIICGSDPRRHIEKIREYADAGFTHVYVHQVGPDQEAFLSFYKREVLPKVRG
jgi:G6PDH family F420-dependent oxidoreductase